MSLPDFGDWRTPPEAPAMRIISTFSGLGGSSLGYRLAGGKVILAVEWEEHAVKTYKANFPSTKVFHGDIADLSAAEAMKRAGISEGELDVFDGSPPCQGFSTSGRRKFDDPRNSLFEQYVRLLEGMRPKAFVMENVSGMVKGKMKLIFADILRLLRSKGYRVRARVLNAKFYGVPQSRERIFFIGIREDLGVDPSHPPSLGRMTTAASATKGLEGVPTMQPRQPSALVREWWPRMRPGELLKDAMIRETGKKITKYFSIIRLNPDRAANTLCKSSAGECSGLLHWDECRGLTIAEAKRLASFPDDYAMHGKYSEQWARIGNCVPPLFMKAVASHVRGLLAKARA